MLGASLFTLQFINWYLLSFCAGENFNANNTCKVTCMCFTPRDFWNQLKCCPESLLRKKVAISNGKRPISDNPIAVDYPIVDDYPMLSNPIADDYPMLDNPIADEYPMLDNTVADDHSMWDNLISDDRPISDNSVAEDGSVLLPTARESRSPRRERIVHNMKKRSQVKNSPNSSCVYPFVHGEQLHREFRDYAENNRFRVLHDCLQHDQGSELYLKCQDFRNVSSLENVIPVVDSNTKTIYANRFCAECSNVKVFKSFHHEFVCSNELLGHWEFLSLEATEENEIDLIRSGLCVYSLQPPDNKTLNTVDSMCLSVRYTNCYQTEDTVVPDFSLNPLAIATQLLGEDKYCSLCGYQSNMLAFSDTGQHVNISVATAFSDEICLREPEDIMSYSFFILLSLDKAMLTKSDDRVMTSRDLECGNQTVEVYDKYMVRRNLFKLKFTRKAFGRFKVECKISNREALGSKPAQGRFVPLIKGH